MPDTETEVFVVLDDLTLRGSGGRDFPGRWRSAFARRGREPLLAWHFQLDGEAPLPRGYLDSVRQRVAQWRTLRGAPRSLRLAFEESGATVSLAVFMPDSERFADYLARVPTLPEKNAMRLLAELVAWLASLVEAPRLLANVELADFFVHARDGLRPNLDFCPAFALLREEAPRSDYRIAREWLERLAGIHQFLKQGRKGTLEEASAGENRAFRPLFKQLESGRDCPLAERFADWEKFLRGEAGGPAKGEPGPEVPLETRSFPSGPLSELLRRRAHEVDPDRYPPASPGAGTTLTFSPYRFDFSVGDPAEARVAHLLPPESWFEESLVDPLNRRLSHPFLKAHHNCLRIRSVYCDESLTLLTGDPSSGIPLPALLAAREGLPNADLFFVSGKLHRALAQFESAGFDPAFVSPWQVELHLESGVANPGMDRLLATEVASWPPWEIVLRVERPAEVYLDGETTASWHWVRAGLSGKFAPALFAWMLDWKRFQWAARAGTLASEPLSWDDRLVALFQAAAKQLDPASTTQREKFLALVEEGLTRA